MDLREFLRSFQNGLADSTRRVAIHAANLQCDVAIIGGGPGGVHTAYKLTTQHLTKGTVCLFEMCDHLGGRVGNNNNVGFSGFPFVNNGVPVQNSGQTGTGGYACISTNTPTSLVRSWRR